VAYLGADYSWARPGGAALKAAGVVAVGRYLATDGRGITAAEYDDLRTHGIGVWLVREVSASGMLGGRPRGVADGQVAQQQIDAAGLPGNTLVYAAADWDVTDAQFAACDDYLSGFASVLGATRTGIYGGLHYLNHAHQAGLAVSFWQAGATSWDHREAPLMPIAFHQTTQTPPLPGTDHNEIFDLTTTTLEADMPLTQADLQAVANYLLNYAAFDKGPSVSVVLREAHNVYAGLYVGGPSVPGGGPIVSLIDGLPARVAQTPVDVQAVAQAVIAQLPASGVTVDEVKAAVAEVVGGTKLVAAS